MTNKVTYEKNNFNKKTVEARPHQIRVEEALQLRPVDLLREEDSYGRRLVSRADLFLILSIFDGGIKEFLEDYKAFVRKIVEERDYIVVNNPHSYLKNILG